MLSRLGITVSGRVQGVGFRMWVLHHARAFGLTGFVTNQRDGSVYLEAQGAPDRLNELLKACREGPPRSRVESVSMQEIPPFESSGFNIR